MFHLHLCTNSTRKLQVIIKLLKTDNKTKCQWFTVRTDESDTFVAAPRRTHTQQL